MEQQRGLTIILRTNKQHLFYFLVFIRFLSLIFMQKVYKYYSNFDVIFQTVVIIIVVS